MHATITLGAETFTDAEQRVLMLVWCASQYGVSPTLERQRDAELLPAAAALVARGLVYQVRADATDYDPLGDSPGGYALRTPEIERLAETLVDASGLEWGEIIRGVPPAGKPTETEPC